MAKRIIPSGFIKSDKIRELREKKKMTPVKFTVAADISACRLSRIENMQTRPENIGVYTLAKIAKRLDVTVDELIDHTKIKFE